MNKKSTRLLSLFTLFALAAGITGCKGDSVVFSASSSQQASSSKENSSMASSEDSSATSSQASSSAASSEISSAPITYTITWANSDGTTLDTDTVKEGVTPKYTGETPTKTADDQYTYTFDGWDPTVVAAVSNATYTAHYSAAVNSYKITWLNYDGTVLEEDTTAYGATPAYDGETPKKASTEKYYYAFTGWTPEISSVSGDTSYTAVFSEIINRYVITWKNENGTILMTDLIAWGATPEYSGTTPSKDRTAVYSYTFDGWTPDIVVATCNATYTAKFKSVLNTYTIKWANEDGTILETDTVNAGETPKYDGATPTKAKNVQYYYSFKGWDTTVTAAYEDKTYTAVYYSNTNYYKISWLNDDGTEIYNNNYKYGVIPSYTSSTPVKEETLEEYYTFTGWSPEITAVSGEASYKAQFEAKPLTYVTDCFDYSYSSTTSSYTVTSLLSDTNKYIEIPSTYDDGTNGTANVTAIEDSAFYSNSNIVFCKLPTTITEIGSSAFANCSNLRQIDIPEGVETINDATFSYCYGLKSVSIPDSITSISGYAFSFCTKLSSISIPKATTSIEEMAFAWCSSLSSITVDSENTAYTAIDNVLFTKDKTALIKMSTDYTGEYTIPDEVTNF